MTQSSSNVKSIFGHALDIQSQAERSKYLDEACHSNLSLRGEVEELIGAVARAGDFLTNAASGGQATIAPSITEQPGTLIGPYKLLEQIGEGGMGVVYVGAD